MGLRGRMLATKAFGFVDLGANAHTNIRYATVDLDIDGSGNIDEVEKTAVKANLYSLALKAGAQPLRGANGVSISVNECVDFSEGGEETKDDKVYIFNKGDVIMLTTIYEDISGTLYEVSEDEVTDLGFDALHYLNDNGFIV